MHHEWQISSRMATHSVEPLAMSVSVNVWTKSPSIFGPTQRSTMSISKNPAVDHINRRK
jgi:hypothetical protein